MTLPVNLILVRHGQSEGNAAKRLSEAGDHSAYSEAFRNRHSGTFRLTKHGRQQAKATGHWIKANIADAFDRYYVSEYIRAKETAALLGLPYGDWLTDPYLTERDWGEIDIAPENERNARFAAELKMRSIEPFFWRPPNGESFMTLCLRIDRVLHTLHRECNDKGHVILVCHGEVMRGIQARLERLPQQRFRELVFSDDPADRIHNCEIMHYTRQNPHSGRIHPYAKWVRKIRPSETPLWDSGWKEIVRPRHTNEALLAEVNQYPSFLD
jgi:NAD+ kinase